MYAIESSFAKRFNEALSLNELRAVDFEKISGLDKSAISQYRSGYATPKLERIVMIANLLSVNPAWLMGLNVHKR